MTAKYDTLSDVAKVARVNPNALNEKGELKSFLEQYGEYALVKEDDPKLSIRYTPFVLSINSSVFGIPPLDDKPLIITNQAIKHIAAKHEAKIKTLSNLSTEIKENALAYEDPVHNRRGAPAVRMRRRPRPCSSQQPERRRAERSPAAAMGRRPRISGAEQARKRLKGGKPSEVVNACAACSA